MSEPRRFRISLNPQTVRQVEGDELRFVQVDGRSVPQVIGVRGDRTTETDIEKVAFGLLNVHAESACVGSCPIHRPSDHHMRDWPLIWRGDKGIFERTCPHGVGHPDPDSLRHAIEYDEDAYAGVHGCEGCCARPVGEVNG